MRTLYKGMMIGGIVGSVIGMAAMTSKRNGMQKNAKRFISKTGKIISSIFQERNENDFLYEQSENNDIYRRYRRIGNNGGFFHTVLRTDLINGGPARYCTHHLLCDPSLCGFFISPWFAVKVCSNSDVYRVDFIASLRDDFFNSKNHQ